IDKFISPAISLYPHFYLNKPFIFTLHDMQERYYPHFFTTKDKILRWLNNRALSKTADKILCESQFVKNDIVKFLGIDPNKIQVVQSPPPKCFNSSTIDVNLYKIIKEKYNLPEEYIFYPAQFWPHKNHIKLLEAFGIVKKEFNDLKLVFTGSKQNNFQSVDRRIQELQLENNIVYLGYIDYSDLPFLYKMSKFLVMPTLFESISIPIYEAFSLKVAVCCSNVVALPEQVGEAGLLFDPNNENDIAEKMIMYLNDSALLEEKASLGYLKINSFDYEAYKNNIIEIIGS
ncbi:glycosyltransferase family 4 protein, partial [Campylobacter concisus]|uniref:glycosyltransferase family 4 protein n=1 Tax=Campylobacter concisus TaxID=199 RepID=UPI0011E817F9